MNKVEEREKMSVSFTSEQQKVIDTHGCNLLVSAAAGSGKTAVLVERIVKMVSDEEHPVDIDRLLVVTFTNAAAAQMRERISNAIAQKLVKEPENEHLQRQSALLHNAQITTIDSFCLFVIRNHFHTIGLDPGFRIGDEGELKLLKQDVLSEVLEQCYQKEEEAFLHCMEYFSTGSRDSAVEEAVLKLYEFAMSHPFPEEWLQERKKDYLLPTHQQNGEGIQEKDQNLMQLPWMQELLDNTGLQLRGMADRMGQCAAVCEEPDGPYMYGELLEQEREKLEKLADAVTYEERYTAFEKLVFGRLPSKKDDTVDAEKRELVKNARTQIKEQVQKLQKDFFACSKEEILRQMAVCQEAVCALVELALLFKQSFEDAKRARNLIDFDDMEHFALSILLQRNEDGSLTPTDTAIEYRSHFAEILIDEYQDSNLVQEYLLSAISGETEGNFNRFMVGDVKQSIYKFRLARPELFLEKYNTYSMEEGQPGLRIDLHKNFRSREEVLHSANAVFSQVMIPELGGIVYDDAAALYPGASYPEPSDSEYDTELLLFHEVEEARGIAAKIKELTTSFQVTDEETGQLRKVHYKDIVILLRTTSGWDEAFKQVLEEEGIPVHVTSKTGYFAAAEVQELLHFLRVLDNPLQDIPLYGVLHSYFGGFFEEEIAEIKAAFPKKRYLYDAVLSYGEKEKEAELWKTTELQQKVQIFLKKIEYYRELAVYMPVHELLQTIIREYSYLSYVAARPGGSKRRANVEMLLVKASDYEKTSYYGLYHFLRYMEQLEKYDVDYGEANLQDENADVVRIMSIHKSKGLEFPVCIVAGLAKGFNNRDTNERLVLDVDLGIGVDYVNPEQRVHSRNIRRNYIAAKLRQDNLAEELRILYVAMTRAKEKLILTGTLKNPEKQLGEGKLVQGTQENAFSYYTLLQMKSFLDVMLLATARESEKTEHRIAVTVVNEEDMTASEVRESLSRESARQRLLLSDMENGIDRTLWEQIKEKFAYTYPYDNLRELYTKTTVSELKKAGMQEEQEFAFSLYEEEPIVPYLPKFIRQEEKISGTDRGSAFHKVMELFDFKTLLECDTEDTRQMTEMMQNALEQMRQQGTLSKTYYEAVSVPKLVHFLQSDAARRMAEADCKGKLYKEQPFVLGLPANRLRETFPDQETVLIQGIIDVFFEENGSYVVLDYKTDAVKEPEELVKRYQVQLDYYGEALEQLSGYKFTGQGMRTAEKIIYSFGLEQEIKLQ